MPPLAMDLAHTDAALDRPGGPARAGVPVTGSVLPRGTGNGPDIFPYDALDVLGLLLAGTGPVTAIDVGANCGEMAERLLRELTGATVYAFEPVPATFDHLRGRASHLPGLRPVQAAVGAADGRATVRVLGDDRFSSVLPMNADTAQRYGALTEQVSTITVPMVRLDDWAALEGVSGATVLKIDVQGLELDVLHGARRLLDQHVVAVKCEAQLTPQYEGASTFAEIDMELRARGFILHQIHELWPLGNERQHVCLDALWLKPAALESLRSMTRGDATLERLIGFRRALRTLAARGAQRVGLYGAGRHTVSLAPVIERSPIKLVCVIDDRTALHGRTVAGLTVVSPEQALARHLDAAILSSDAHEQRLWDASAPFREAGVSVVRLYQPAAFAHARLHVNLP